MRLLTVSCLKHSLYILFILSYSMIYTLGALTTRMLISAVCVWPWDSLTTWCQHVASVRGSFGHPVNAALEKGTNLVSRITFSPHSWMHRRYMGTMTRHQFYWGQWMVSHVVFIAYINYRKLWAFLISDKAPFSEMEKVRDLSRSYLFTSYDW